MAETVRMEIKGPVAVVTIAHKGGLNILDEDTLLGIEAAVEDIAADEDVRVAVITGAGKTFIAGADIKMMPLLDMNEGRRMALLGQRVFAAIASSEKPFVAAVNGIAFGGGMELVLACDLVYASSAAQFGQLEVNVGLIPGWGGSQRLAKLAGANKAKEICMFGEPMGAEAAAAFGIVNAVFSPEEHMDAVMERANTLAGKSPLALKYIKRSVNAGLDAPLTTGLQLEADLFGLMCGSEDQNEGAKAFLEKRKPDYEGK